MTLAPAVLSAIGTAIDAIAAGHFAEFHDALVADGVAADAIADLDAFFLAESLTWRQEQLPALLAAALLEPAIH